MFSKFLSNLAVLFVCLISMIAFNGCGSASDSAATSYSYSGPGSHYTVSMSSSTFTINKFASSSATTADFVVSGTVSTVFGFKKLTVSSVTGTGGPTAGDVAYGIEVPGLALFIKPMDPSKPDQIISAVASGTCPTSQLDANWIIVKKADAANVSSSSQDLFGTFTFSPTTGVASVSHRYSVMAPTTDLGANTFASSTCTNGVMSVASGGDTAVLYLTSGGGAIVNTASSSSANASYIFGLPQATITPSDFAATYSGFVYMGGQSSGSQFKAIKFVLTATSSTISGTGTMLTDASTDTVSSDTAQLSLTTLNSPSTGFMTGTLTTTGGTSNVACMAVANANSSGKQIINCAGVDPGSTTNLFNFLLVSR